MKKEKNSFIGAGFLLAFVLWTVMVHFVDVKAIGPQGSSVGFASVNRFVQALTGVHFSLYTLTDWLSVVPVCFAMGFALLGLWQWIRRKHLLKVDRSLLTLGGVYLIVAVVYGFFEVVAINYRPVLIDGILEASYPSSTTVLSLCVMLTAATQLDIRIKDATWRRCAVLAVRAFAVFMVMARLISGVHWFSDIAGGVLLSLGLVRLYNAVGAQE